MQSNFYGSCTGGSGGKYDVWLTVKENSQSIANNTSNITVSMYLKRNDGYAGSAYNLYTEQNTAKITVGGVQRVNKNLNIDTRNGVTVLLGSWTGNISHNDDGKLNLAVSGTFTMGNTGLSGGTASGTFKCTTIPRLSTATLSASTVNPGSSVTVTITSASNSFNHKIKWSLGANAQTNSLSAGVKSSSFTVPVDWVNGLPSSNKGTLNATLYTYTGTTLIGKKVYSVSLVIPETDAYKPSFTLKVERIDNSVPQTFNEYVQGISQVKVSVEDLTFKYSSVQKNVSVKVGGVEKRELPAIFSLPDFGEINISVSIKDSRGFTSAKDTKINVLQYAPASVNIISLIRCDSSGVPNTYGTYLSAKYTVCYSSLNSKNICKLSVKYKSAGDTYSNPVSISGGTSIIGSGAISINNSYDVCFTVADSINTKGIEITRSVSSANIPFNIKRGGKGAAFGKFCENEGELSVGWDLAVDGGVSVFGGASINGDLAIGGCLDFQEVGCLNTENSKSVTSTIRYYPCFNMCYLRIRMRAADELSAGVSYKMINIDNKPSNLFTPITGVASLSSGLVSVVAGVNYKTGEIVVVPSVNIPANTLIYVSGIYIADYTE